MENFMRLILLSVVVTELILYTVGPGIHGQQIIFIDEDYSNREDHNCDDVNGGDGECVDIRSCPMLLALIHDPDQHKFLAQSRCGWNKTTPMVCCDKKHNCTNPDNEPGQCIHITSCPHVFDLVVKSIFLNESTTVLPSHRCGPDELHVCCTSLNSKFNDEVTITSTTTKKISDDNTSDSPNGNKFDPPNENTSDPPKLMARPCGQDASSNRIIGGEVTSIDQYPWATAIEYAKNDVVEVKCGGTLISDTYVVTAAHCFFDKGWIPLNVRLGEYDIDHPGVDCVATEGGGEDCTDEVVIISIAKIITHPGYVHNSSMRAKPNDIGLIQLQEAAPYTDFIRPICLPSTDFTQTTGITIDLKVAGWGASDEIRKYSSVKRHVTLPFVNRENCINFYKRLNVSLGDGQICAGGEKGKDTCKGDSGGALMQIKDQGVEIVGVTSFGLTPCGLENVPAVYTKIHHYLPWIRSIIS